MNQSPVLDTGVSADDRMGNRSAVADIGPLHDHAVFYGRAVSDSDAGTDTDARSDAAPLEFGRGVDDRRWTQHQVGRREVVIHDLRQCDLFAVRCANRCKQPFVRIQVRLGRSHAEWRMVRVPVQHGFAARGELVQRRAEQTCQDAVTGIHVPQGTGVAQRLRVEDPGHDRVVDPGHDRVVDPGRYHIDPGSPVGISRRIACAPPRPDTPWTAFAIRMDQAPVHSRFQQHGTGGNQKRRVFREGRQFPDALKQALFALFDHALPVRTVPAGQVNQRHVPACPVAAQRRDLPGVPAGRDQRFLHTGALIAIQDPLDHRRVGQGKEQARTAIPCDGPARIAVRGQDDTFYRPAILHGATAPGGRSGPGGTPG